MLYTSAQANKLLKQLQEDYRLLVANESMSRTFIAATNEDLESARPAYDYDQTQQALRDLQAKVRKIKHAINVFNTTHVVEGFDLTVDQMLVYIPQLSECKNRLAYMANVLPKNRLSTNGGALIEYEYTNYDPEKVKADLAAVSDELNRAQLALDKLNQTELMEIDL
ncbi:MAG: hypothetical protein IJ744_00535 [Lachnospiraceae bacterium]|nr:hypothetical protein [Lachnospiraceae bacterium]